MRGTHCNRCERSGHIVITSYFSTSTYRPCCRPAPTGSILPAQRGARIEDRLGQRPTGERRPALYSTETRQVALDATDQRDLHPTRLAGQGIAVGDASAWDCPLDVSPEHAGGDPFARKNPVYRITSYLQHRGRRDVVAGNGSAAHAVAASPPPGTRLRISPAARRCSQARRARLHQWFIQVTLCVEAALLGPLR